MTAPGFWECMARALEAVNDRRMSFGTIVKQLEQNVCRGKLLGKKRILS
jgi:hypothetical protein